jgi:hypothetical protein
VAAGLGELGTTPLRGEMLVKFCPAQQLYLNQQFLLERVVYPAPTGALLFLQLQVAHPELTL